MVLFAEVNRFFIMYSFGKFYAWRGKRVGKLRESDILLGESALVLREYCGLD